MSLVKGFSEFVWERDYAPEHVAFRLKRPRRPRPEELDVVTVTADDVRRMLDSCETWQEYLCLSTAIYLGAPGGRWRTFVAETSISTTERFALSRRGARC